ncbi:MAG: nucleoside hydrolase [Sphaerochaetaceae bacterium]|nr:nucleoside hydrolase [Sphaerochaetaceae bacterium]
MDAKTEKEVEDGTNHTRRRPGHDDAVALVLAAGSPQIQIEGVVAVAGNQVRRKTLENTLNVCDYLGIDAPVFPGMDRPIVREQVTAGDIHGETGLDGPVFPPRKKQAERGYGVQFIIDTVLANPHEITLVPTGPLTDIAMAIRLEPKVAELVKQIVFMGGSTGEGNVTYSAEFNIYADPEAAQIVCTCGAPLVMMGLDVTLQVMLTDERLDGYRKFQGKAAKMFCASMDNYMASCRRHGHDYPAMHDPCCVAYLIDPGMFVCERRELLIELRGTHTYGRTVAGPYLQDGGVLIAKKTEPEKFWKLMDMAFGRLL